MRRRPARMGSDQARLGHTAGGSRPPRSSPAGKSPLPRRSSPDRAGQEGLWLGLGMAGIFGSDSEHQGLSLPARLRAVAAPRIRRGTRASKSASPVYALGTTLHPVSSTIATLVVISGLLHDLYSVSAADRPIRPFSGPKKGVSAPGSESPDRRGATCYSAAACTVAGAALSGRGFSTPGPERRGKFCRRRVAEQAGAWRNNDSLQRNYDFVRINNMNT